MKKGIDLSYWQKNIDWREVDNASLNFVYIKLTEGVTYIDPIAVSHIGNSKLHQLKIGYYHFAKLENNDDMTKCGYQEAFFFNEQLKQYSIDSDLAPALDIEVNKLKFAPDKVDLFINAFRDRMRVYGFPDIIIYSYPSYLNTFLPDNHEQGDCPLWIADPNSTTTPILPRGWTDWTIWQYNSTNKIGDVVVDWNYCKDEFLDN